MRVTLWGTRGSLATAGADTLRYGGNTSCVEVRSTDDQLIVLDAGSGIRRLGSRVCPVRTDLLLSHLHMDHLLGVGFYRPLYESACQVHVWVPPSKTLDLRARLTRYFSPPLFPTPLRELPCQLELHEVPRGRFRIGGVRVTSDLICHPGITVGYRLETDDGALAYLADHEPALGSTDFPRNPTWTSGWGLAQNVDLLIHDSQYTLDEYASRVGWGHSAVDHAIQFADLAGAATLVTFHHDPAHSDAVIDTILADALARIAHRCQVIPGTEGAGFELQSGRLSHWDSWTMAG